MNIELTCPFCSYSKSVPQEKIPADARGVTCPRCKRRFEMPAFLHEDGFNTDNKDSDESRQSTDQGPDAETVRTGAPWERRSELGLWRGLFKTMKGVLFSPEKLFASMTQKAGILEPLAFGLLFGSLGSMFALFWQALILAGTLRSMLGDYDLGHLTLGIISVGTIFIILLVMVFVVLGMFISSAIWHLLLLIVGGANKGYEATYRVVAYSRAAQIWILIPIVGGMICWIWQIVIQITGLRNIHETSYARVIFAFLILVAFIVLLFAFSFILLFALVGRQMLGQP